MRSTPDVSLVIPVHDEADSIPKLVVALDALLAKLDRAEVVFIDDGSRDRSFELLRDAARTRPAFRVARLRRNFGQTAAIAAGIDHARAPILVALDADLQNDPEDVPALLARLDEGFDVVSGWRRRREDPISKRIPSAIANALIRRFTGVPIHDFGCTLKAYRRWVLEPYPLYGEMHRFIPIFATWAGGRVTEMEVRHHPRAAGRSKYGLGRVYKVLLDLLTVIFLGGFTTKPIYFLGAPGLVSCSLGLLAAFVFVVQFVKEHVLLVAGVWVQPSTLLLLAVFLATTGIYMLSVGLLAELLMRTYFESQRKKTYLVGELVGFADEHGEGG